MHAVCVRENGSCDFREGNNSSQIVIRVRCLTFCHFNERLIGLNRRNSLVLQISSTGKQNNKIPRYLVKFPRSRSSPRSQLTNFCFSVNIKRIHLIHLISFGTEEVSTRAVHLVFKAHRQICSYVVTNTSRLDNFKIILTMELQNQRQVGTKVGLHQLGSLILK